MTFNTKALRHFNDRSFGSETGLMECFAKLVFGEPPAHTPVLPFSAHDPFSQVSLPNSPGRGMVSKRHSCLPLFHVEGADQALGVVVGRHRRRPRAWKSQ